MISLHALHFCTYYPSPKVPQKIDVEEIGAVWKEGERDRGKAVWARYPNYGKHDNEWC